MPRPARLHDTWRQYATKLKHWAHGGTAVQAWRGRNGLLCGGAQVVGAPDSKAKAGGGITGLNRCGLARMQAAAQLRRPASPALAAPPPLL